MIDDDDSPYAEDVGMSGYKPWMGHELKAMQPAFKDEHMDTRAHLTACLIVVLAGIGVIVWIAINLWRVAQ